MTAASLLPIVSAVPLPIRRSTRTMPPSDPRQPTTSATDPASTWDSAYADHDHADSGNSPWWRLALAVALAVVGMAATASLLA